jgi:uncharacterized membrane protein
MSAFQHYLGMAGTVIETIGVLTIIAGFILSAAWFVGRLRRIESLEAYRQLRQDLGRSLILGLEFLVAGDIIRTIVIEQTLDSAATLAIIVIIRIILSLTLELEVDGRWPWQRQ